MNSRDTKDINLVIFHFPCQDGLASASVAKKFNPNVELFPVQHMATYTDEFFIKLYTTVMNKNVGIFDFSFSLPITLKIKELAKNLIILDHHVTNQKTLQDLDYAKFDMNLSGVGLTWKFYYPDQELPLFYKMIQDRDLWSWSVPYSKEFCSGLSFYTNSCSLNNSFAYFDELFTTPSKMDDYIKLGSELQKKTDQTITKMVSTTRKIYNYVFNNKTYKVKIINNTDTSLTSSLGNMLCSDGSCDFSVIWRYDHEANKYYLSLRSDNKTNRADVSVICKAFGGGGHKNASGCAIDIHPNIFFMN